MLKRVLPFAYPKVKAPIELRFPEDDNFIDVLLKYEVRLGGRLGVGVSSSDGALAMVRGLEAVALAFWCELNSQVGKIHS